jgi:hypothetical protein
MDVNTTTHRIMGLVILAILITAGPVAAQSTGDGIEGATEDPALYAVGALGASNLYTSYFLLGTLADGYATAAYTAQFADELTRDVIGLGESSIEVLQQLLAESSLAGADKALVQDMITAHGLLIDQAWGLLEYVEDSSNTEAWFRYRRQAWELISVLLDIN